MAAIGIMAGLRERGLNVPGDVAVIGIDNLEFAEYVKPTLTSGGVCGEAFAEILLNLSRCKALRHLAVSTPHPGIGRTAIWERRGAARKCRSRKSGRPVGHGWYSAESCRVLMSG
ncbi:MAG: substrate-binding domain-containing protein [Candidatus Pacebacteria bacterium]|nr:substrate-binding domain-containing protein [Candidatus Paceibacterota bacterium]